MFQKDICIKGKAVYFITRAGSDTNGAKWRKTKVNNNSYYNPYLTGRLYDFVEINRVIDRSNLTLMSGDSGGPLMTISYNKNTNKYTRRIVGTAKCVNKGYVYYIKPYLSANNTGIIRY